jgi:hypothetical protein
MKTLLTAIAMASLLALTGCGGDDSTPPPTGPTIAAFSADAASYWLGEQARLTVMFSNGTGTLEPEGIAVTSGQTITTETLSTPITYRLVVTDGATTVSRTLNLNVRYRDRLRAVAMPFSRGEHRAVHLPDDRVLIIGGENETNLFPATVYAFNPATETFAPFAELSSGRTGHIAQLLNNGDVLVSGGSRGVLMASEAEVIDHVTGAVAPTQNSPVQRRERAASTLLMDGKVFICGGHIGAGVTDSVEVYDPETRTFTLLPAPLKVARLMHTVVRIDQRRLLVYGGFTEDSDPAPPEIYDVAGESTLLTAPEAGVRGNHRAITLQDGGILIVGGEDYDQMPLATVLRFDPGSSTFAPYATLATPRSAMAINRLVDGRLFIAGGVTDVLSSSSTHTTELLTDTAQRRDGPDMGVRRRDHTVTRLNSGKLLIVGGLGTDLWPLASAEIYE